VAGGKAAVHDKRLTHALAARDDLMRAVNVQPPRRGISRNRSADVSCTHDRQTPPGQSRGDAE